MAGRESALLEGEQLGHLLRKVIAVDRAQRAQRSPVAAPGAADAEVDTTRVQPVERAIGLDHTQRHMVGQHDAARADVDALRRRR